jgi:thiol-disulfide isomerase/thioredoxin
MALSLIGCSGTQSSEYMGASGEPINIKGDPNWTLVAYWADWCSNCLKEVPSLNALSHQKGLQVVGRFFQPLPTSDLKILSDKVGIEFPVLTQDPKEDFNWAPLVGLPTHYLISPDNIVYGPYRGPLDKDQIEAVMRG